MPKTQGMWLAMLLAVSVPAAAAAQKKSEPLPPDPTEDPMLLAAGFLQQHPDLAYRKYGMDALKEKRYAKAMAHFRKASYYADKPSQAMVAELLWFGTGTARDRAAAYAWMDLAAEREYRVFALQREKYWLDMDEAERKRALELGKELYATYGDDQAKPRITRALRWEKSKAVGSRLGGFAGASVQVGTPGVDGELSNAVDGSKFYDARFWDPDKYWDYTDRLWHNIGKQGRVTVGEVREVSETQIKDAEAAGDPNGAPNADKKPD